MTDITQVASGIITTASGVAANVAQTTDDMLKGYLLTALQKTGNVMDKAVDMVIEQTPILVQEILHWYFAYNLIICITSILGIGLIIWLNVKQYNWVKKQSELPSKQQSEVYNCWTDGVFISNIFQIIPIGFMASMINLTWLKIIIAPRLWLIEYAANLIHK